MCKRFLVITSISFKDKLGQRQQFMVMYGYISGDNLYILKRLARTETVIYDYIVKVGHVALMIEWSKK